MRRIAIINQKGGVGKTTTSVNLGVALARAGNRVLLIDLDPQAHLSLHLGIDPAAGKPGTYELLTGSETISKVRTKVGTNIWVVGSSIDLAATEVELVSVVGREVILRDLLDQHVGGPNRTPQYDYVLMDCPPSLGVLTLNGLCAAHEVFIPLQPHYLALQGLGKLLETVSLVGKRINPGLKVGGVVVCMHDAGTKLAAEVIEDVRTFFENDRGKPVAWSEAKVFDAVIRRNIKLAEAPSYGKSIFEYAPDSNGSKDYEQLAGEVDGRSALKVVPATAEISPAEPPPAVPAESIEQSGAPPVPAAEAELAAPPESAPAENDHATPATDVPAEMTTPAPPPVERKPRVRRPHPELPPPVLETPEPPVPIQQSA